MTKWDAMKPYVAVLGATILTSTLGASYLIGNLTPYWISYFKAKGISTWINSSYFIWISALCILGQGFLMWFGGMLVTKIGCRATAVIGSVIYSFFLGISYFTINVGFIAFATTYAFLSWIGGGLVWVAAISQGFRWFPNNVGLSTSLINVGFGIGGIILSPLSTLYINPDNLSPDRGKSPELYFSDESLIEHVRNFFWILTIFTLAINALSILLLQEKKSSDVKEIITIDCMETECKSINLTETKLSEISPLEMLKLKEFYFICISFSVFMFPINFVNSYQKVYGQTFIKDDKFLSVVSGLGPLFACIGKVFWGFLSDKLSYRLLMSLFIGSMMIFVQALVAAQYITTYPKVFYTIVTLLFFSNIGGNYSIVPTVICKAFGSENAPTNYGIIFFSIGIGSLVAAFITQIIQDNFHYKYSFTFYAGFASIGLILTFFLPKNLESIRKVK